MISAKIIADSVNPKGKRITTFICEFPRIILAEVNTHRMLTRSSASSRAIPFNKMLDRVQNDPFIPIKWMKDHSGMQGNEFFEESDELVVDWLIARDNAIIQAKNLSNKGLTKQIVNRLLEPFMYHIALITATDYENFFALRAEGAAEIHLQDLAFKMLEEINSSNPSSLKEGQWHIPFGDKIDLPRLLNQIEGSHYYNENIEMLKVKIATARCARVSYLNFDGKDNYLDDLKLHDRLSKMGHWSAFEHCASANSDELYRGNFCGFTQYRKMFTDENRSDSRLKSLK